MKEVSIQSPTWQQKNQKPVTENNKLGFKSKINGWARSSARIEHRAFNPGVGGSIPLGPAKNPANIKTILLILINSVRIFSWSLG